MPTFQDKFLTDGENSNVKVPSHYEYGKQRTISVEFTLPSELAVGDIIQGPKLPRNCIILDAKVKCLNMGATGIFSLGTLNDLDGLVPVADAGGQNVNERDGADSELIGTYIGDDVEQLGFECIEATAAGTGIKLQAFITVIVE